MAVRHCPALAFFTEYYLLSTKQQQWALCIGITCECKTAVCEAEWDQDNGSDNSGSFFCLFSTSLLQKPLHSYTTVHSGRQMLRVQVQISNWVETKWNCELLEPLSSPSRKYCQDIKIEEMWPCKLAGMEGLKLCPPFCMLYGLEGADGQNSILPCTVLTDIKCVFTARFTLCTSNVKTKINAVCVWYMHSYSFIINT